MLRVAELRRLGLGHWSQARSDSEIPRFWCPGLAMWDPYVGWEVETCTGQGWSKPVFCFGS